MKKLLVSLALLMTLTSSAVGLSACGDKDGEGSPNHSHNYSSEEVMATCTEQGYTKYTCSCGKSYNENVTPALGHDLRSYSAKAATCEEVGYNAYENCGRCDYSTYVKIPELGHTELNGFCETCEQKLRSEGLSYSLINNDTEYEVSLGSCTESEIVIPDVYNGLPVTRIADDAFYQNASLRSITIGKNIVDIGNNAFWACSYLVEINFNATDMQDLSLSNNVFYNAGINSTGITVNVGKNVTRIPAHLFRPNSDFSYSPKITSVIFEGNSVVSIGEGAFAKLRYLTSINLPDSLTTIEYSAFHECKALRKINLGNGVQEIGDAAFAFCSALTDLVIPESVTTIGENAFLSCSALVSVDIGDGVQTIGANAFQNCSSLVNVFIGDNVQTIQPRAFYECSSLLTVTIGDGVQTIGEQAFYECNALVSVWIGSGVEEIGSLAFSHCNSLMSLKVEKDNGTYHSAGNCIIESASKTLVVGCNNSVIPTDGSIEVIGAEAFFDCDNLIEVTIPDSVKKIESSAFNNCSSLLIVSLGDNLEEIESSAFYGCSNLISIVIPDSVTTIGEQAFYDCTSLTSAVIGDGVTTMGDNAFYNCHSLVSVILGKKVENIGDSTFQSCSSLRSVVIPDSVKSIGREAFYGCNLLANVNIPSKVEYIGSSAFYNCSQIENIVIPYGVESIGDNAFYGCSNLKTITIPGSVTSIGTSAFYNCTSLTTVYYDGTIDNWAMMTFDNNTSNPLYRATNFYINGEDYLQKDTINLTSATKVGAYAFYGFDKLENITIPSAITSIGTYAFYGCVSLESITIPENLENLGSYAFYDCRNLTEINFNAVQCRDDLYSSNGIFYNAGQDGLGIQVNIGANVTKIPENLFNPNGSSNVPYIVRVEFKENSVCQEIGFNSFGYASSLVQVVIPASVQTIGSRAFYGCSNLSKVLFGGENLDDWTSINIGTYNTELNDAKRYYYSTTEPTLADNGIEYDGNYWCYEDGVSAIWVPSHITIQATDINFNDSALTWEEKGCWIMPSGGTEENATWTLQGDGSLKSADIDAAGKTWYELYMTGSGTFNYSYKTSSEASFDKLIVYKNGVSTGVEASGQMSSFTSASISVVAGDVIRFTYSKDGSVDSGDDAVYVKFTNVIPNLPALGDLYGVRNSDISSKLTTVTVEGTGKISNSYFKDCEDITTVIIGVNVTQISENAFAGCTSLTDVFYEGNYDGWNYLVNSQNIGVNNEELMNANIYYFSDKEPANDGNLYWHYVDGVVTVWGN